MGGERGKEGGAGEASVRLVSAAPTPTSCPPSCSCHHILPCLGQGTLVGGVRARTEDPALAPLSCPLQIQGGASALCPGPGPRHGTLALRLGHSSASTA